MKKKQESSGDSVRQPQCVIRELLPVHGEWFYVVRRFREPQTWRLSRVISWAVIDQGGKVDLFTALTGPGLPYQQDLPTMSAFVFGGDKSPTGQTWKELYDCTLPEFYDMHDHDITEAMQKVAPTT
jgi:hypothetical protein